MSILSTLNNILPIFSKKLSKQMKEEKVKFVFIKMEVSDSGLKIIAMQKELENSERINIDVEETNLKLLE